MRDVAGRSIELLLGRDEADTDVSDHRGDEAGREDVAKVKVDAGCDVSGYSAGVTDSGIWRSNRACKHRECAYIDVRTSDFTCEDAQNGVVEHSVKTSSAHVNILSSGSIQTRAMWCFIHQT